MLQNVPSLLRYKGFLITIIARRFSTTDSVQSTTQNVTGEAGVRGGVSVEIRGIKAPKSLNMIIARRFSSTDSSKHETQVPPALHFGGAVLPFLLFTPSDRNLAQFQGTCEARMKLIKMRFESRDERRAQGCYSGETFKQQGLSDLFAPASERSMQRCSLTDTN